MQVAGLHGDRTTVEAGASWVARQVRGGRRRLDPDMIREAVKELDLQQGPSRAVLSIARPKPDPLADRAICAADWHERFAGDDAYNKRRPAPPATWRQLQDEIESTSRSPSETSCGPRPTTTNQLGIREPFRTPRARMPGRDAIFDTLKGQLYGNPSSTCATARHTQVRAVPLPAPARYALGAWLDVRGREPGPLWLGQRGRLTTSGITQVVVAVGDDAGIDDLRPHRWRHTYATRLRQGGADIAQISDLLGNASIDTTARYFRSRAAETAAVVARVFDAAG